MRNGVEEEVGEGMLVFFEKGCTRKMESDRENPIRFYTVNFMHMVPEYTQDGWKLQTSALSFDFVKKIHDSALCERFCRLFEKLCAVHISSAYMRQAKEREIMGKILETAMFAYESGTDNYINKIRTEKVISYMYENYDRRIVLSDLAKIAGVSVSYFTAMFKSVTSESPIDFLISIRIRKAKEMLGSGADVKTAAEKCGFSDIFYFSRLFKKREQMTPTEYIRDVGNRY